jgi:hypothetical protein
MKKPKAQTRRADFPLADRTMELRGFKRRAAPAEGATSADTDVPLATAQLVFTTGAGVQRYDWSNDRYYVEELVVDAKSIRMDRLAAGAPLLNTHDSWELEAVLGVVDTPQVQGGEGTCNVTFSRRDSVAGYVQDVEDKVIRNVSVGYVRHAMEMVAPGDDSGMWRYRVTDWEPYEVSLVPIPADMGAQVRGDAEPATNRDKRTFPCQITEVKPTVGVTAAISTQGASMSGTQAAGGTNAPAQPTTRESEVEGQGVTVVAGEISEIQRQAQTLERQRAADITSLCARHGVKADRVQEFISKGTGLDAVRTALLDEIAAADTLRGNTGANVRVETVNDEVKTRLAGIEEAIRHRVLVLPDKELTDNGRQYRGMSLIEIGREHLERCNVRTRGMTRMALATAILTHRTGVYQTTSDFASLLANVANKRLRQGYEENRATYQVWARRAPDAPDFKSMSVVNLAGAPDLLQVNEHGEFKYGAMTDGKETYSMLTYGRIVPFSRQSLINDDLRGFDRLVGAFGNSAARLENRTVYAILTANAALGDGVALFHATHGNLAGSGGAISITTLGAGRAAMRLQKGLQSEELNLAPRYLITPATQEALAYQYTSSQFVPTQSSQVNEFRAGGRTALEPVVEALLDANSTTAWYLAADNGQVDTVEYCWLEGAAGPVIENEVGFEVDGISYKCRLDFAAKGIDSRGLYKNPGA